MSMQESKSSDSSGVLAAANLEAVATSMEWDAEQGRPGGRGGQAEEYELSAALNEGHEYAVRDVSSAGKDCIATLEEKGRVAVFERVAAAGSSGGASLGEEPAMEWLRSGRVEARVHASLAFVLENVEGCCMRGESRAASSSVAARTHYPRGTFMSGGGDKAARPWTANGSSFSALQGHTGPVNSISWTLPDRLVVTGSWDGVVRLWHGDELLKSFDKLGHAHGTEVLGLEGGAIVTASTTGAIVIIDKEGKVLFRNDKAHEAPIRKLIPHPLGFASAANDGLVKIWNAKGQLVQRIDAATSSEVKFLYGLCFLPGAGGNLDRSRLVTCGEDGMVRVFDFKGDCVQTIPHPGPVRSVKPLGGAGPDGAATADEEGDFLTACADKTVRVFTRCAARFAPEKLRSEFRELGELVRSAGGMKSLDTSSMEDESALQKPGTKNGQVKVLNISGRNVPIAYQWSDDLHEWIEIGEALGAGGGGGGGGAGGSSGGRRSMHEGREYDFVSDVYLTDEHVVKLAFNADDDPVEVTERFSTIYQVPQDMRQQILDFVRPKCDSAALESRRAREAAAAGSQVVLQQVPSWTSGSFETYSAANIAAMEKKIRESNAALVAADPPHPHALTKEADLRALQALFNSLRDTTQFHVAEFSDAEVSVVKHLLHWPADHSLAVLDCLRVLMVHSGANARLGSDAAVHERVFALVKEGKKDTHQLLALKFLSNWVAKRAREPCERAEGAPSAPRSVIDLLTRAIHELADVPAKENENLALAYIMFLHNIVCWIGRLKLVEKPDFFALLAKQICALLTAPAKRNSKIHFYALLTLGSIAYASPAARDQLRSAFSAPFAGFVAAGASSDNAALQQVAQDCKTLYQL